MELVRRRSSSTPPRSRKVPVEDEWGMEAEAEYYNRKQLERAYYGEAYEGATKDWGLVDVPPGTNRVRMDGIGGGGQEITWQRYNGARRARFYADGQEYATDFGALEKAPAPSPLPAPAPRPEPPPPPPPVVRERELIITRDTGPPAPPPPKQVPRDMWTEITKDLVIKEAIDTMGYGCEETDEFFYVMEYLRYVSRFPPQLINLITHYQC